MKLGVTLDIFSGNPNPGWEMTDEQVEEFLEIKGWKEIMNPEQFGVELDLGYRGFIVSIISDSDQTEGQKFIPDEFRIFGTYNTTINRNFPNSIEIEKIRDLEKWILKTGGNSIDDELKKIVENSIDGQFPKPFRNESEDIDEAKAAPCNDVPTGYNPGFWNNKRHIKLNSPYNYACNSRTDTFAQPGRAHNCFGSLISCKDILAAASCDGVTNNCQSQLNYHYIALVIWPGQDYHWYRKHSEGFWGHKPGQTYIRNTDNSGRIITNIETCNRGPYTHWCGYTHAPHNIIIR